MPIARIFWGAIATKLGSERLAAWNAKPKASNAAVDWDDLAASVLLLAGVSLIEPNEPKFVTMVEFVERELRREQHVMRYFGSDDFSFRDRLSDLPFLAD